MNKQRMHRRRARTGFLVFRLALLLSGTMLACGEVSTHEGPSLDSRWHDLRRAAWIRREEVRAVAANHLGHWNAVRKYEALFRMFRVEDRIPRGPQTDELTRQVEAAARAAGFQTVQVETRLADPPPPTLPEVVDTPGGYAFRPEEVAGSIVVVIRARPADLALAERIVSDLREALPRLFVPRSVRLGRGEVTVHGTAYFFHDIRPPVQRIPAPDLDADIARVGLSAASRDPAVADVVLELTRLYGDVAVAAALSGPSLFEAARARLLAARFEFFKARSREAETVSFSELLQP